MAPLKCYKKEPQEWIAGIYLRVSTFDQAREGHSYEEQEKDLRRLCENRGFKIYDVYGDPGISGKYLDKRKNFQKLLDDIRLGNINVIVVWRLDRLVRGVANTQKVISVARQYNCRIVTSWNDLDYSSATGKYQINMEAAHGEYELDVISERTKLGLLGAIEKGHIPKPPFGYKRDKDGLDPKKVIIDEHDAPYIVTAFEMYAQGKSAKAITNYLNETYPGRKKFTKGGVEKTLNNECYIGIYRCKQMERETGEECAYKVLPPIIDDKLWEEVQNQHRINKLTYMKKQTYIFMQKIKCPCCGHDVLGGCAGSKKQYNYYQCNRCKKTGYISEQQLEEIFISEMNAVLDYFIIADIGTMAIQNKTLMKEDEKEYKHFEKELKEREKRIKQAYFDGFMKQDEFYDEMRMIKLKQDQIVKDVAKLKGKDLRISEDMDISMYATITEIEKRKAVSYCSRSNEIWYKMTMQERQLLVADYVESIEIELDKKTKKLKGIKRINFKERKISNLAFMFREQIMDMTVKKEDKNILISAPKTKREIDNFVDELRKTHNVTATTITIDDVKFDDMDENKIVKIMPIENTSKIRKQKYTIISI